MYLELFEKLSEVTEVVATADPQKVMKDYYKGNPTKLAQSTWPSFKEMLQLKFWILTDGTLIPVERAHFDTAMNAGLRGGSELVRAGAVRGYVTRRGELGVDIIKRLTNQQKSRIKNLAIEYKVTYIVAEIGDKGWQSDVKSSKHLDYLLTYGIDEARDEEDEKELLEKLITEEVAIEDPQKLMKDYYKGKSTKLKLSTWDSAVEKGWYKFWILTDGTLIPVDYSHAKTANDALDMGKGGRGFLLTTGAVIGHIEDNTKELVVTASKKLTRKQIPVLRNLGIEYKVTSIFADIGGKDWTSRIKSSKHLDYLLTYGIDEARDEEDEKELLEKLIGESPDLVATADPQKVMKDYYKKVLNTKLTLSTWPSERESHEYKFWLLQDGTVIPVVYSHAKTVVEIGAVEDKRGYLISGRGFIETGAVAGYISDFTNELGISASKKLTTKQISRLKNLYIEYKATRLVAEIGAKDFDAPIKSSKHLDYMLTYAEALDESESEEDEKEQFFVERTEKHIGLVQDAAAKIVDAHPEFDELLKQVEVHDQSKLEEPERTPYVEITWRHKLEKEKGEYDPYNGKGYQTPGQLEKEEENNATIHHITTNSHHPEYHLEDKSDANVDMDDRSKSELVDASRMPDIDIAEMVADWAAMSEEIQLNTAREWFEKQKDVRWHFSEHQEELIDKLLKVFEEENGNE